MLALLHEGTPTPLAAPSPLAAPTPEPSCAQNEFCEFIFDQTGNAWLAQSSYWAIIKPLLILLIIVVAFLVRFIIHRAIDRLVRHTIADDAGFSLLRPLRTRIPTTLGLPTERREQRGRALGSVLRSIASAVVFAVALMLILSEIGLNLGPLLASAGVAGLAIGFGAQNLVKDFLAGLFMLLEDQYGVGDVVTVEGATGTIEDLTLRVTRLRAVDGTVWFVPNGEIRKVGNSSMEWSRALIDVLVPYDADLDLVRRLIREEAEAFSLDPSWTGRVLEPPELWGVQAMEANHLIIRLVVKTGPREQFAVARELRGRISDRLRRQGVRGPGATVLVTAPAVAEPDAKGNS